MQSARFSGELFAPDINPAAHMINKARSSYVDRRFSDRRKRIARRAERDTFRCILMPALYIIGALGLVAFCAMAVYGVLADTDIRPFSVIAAAPAALIGLTEAYRLFRGHHSDSLDEP
jgi:hypothetical protein